MKQIGTCCNCSDPIFNDICHIEYFLLPTKTYACSKCDTYYDAVMVFLALLMCLNGKKSWNCFRILKENNDN